MKSRFSTAAKLRGGPDSKKPGHPKPRMAYLALDTGQLYICFEEGIWAKYGKITGFNPGYSMTRVTSVSKEVKVG